MLKPKENYILYTEIFTSGEIKTASRSVFYLWNSVSALVMIC